MADSKKISELEVAQNLTDAQVPVIQGGQNKRAPAGLFQPYSDDLTSLDGLAATVGRLAYRTATGWELLGSGLAGEVLSSQGNNQIPVWKKAPTLVIRSTDLVRTGSSLLPDPELKFAMAVNEKAFFRGVIFAEVFAAQDFSYQVAAPGFYQLYKLSQRHILPSGTGFSGLSVAILPTRIDLSATFNDTAAIFFEGLVRTGGVTPGDVSFDWCQATAGGAGATVYAGSFIEYFKF